MSPSMLIKELHTSQHTANVEHMEFAGTAATLYSGTTTRDSTTDWIVDTGATSHMTPHIHWFNQYKPHKVPVRLANDYIVYSAGIGTVCFQPLIQGKPGNILEFYRVLHVPQLKNNLLSALYLSLEKSYTIIIDAPTILFKRNNVLNFTASIHSNYCATVDGNIISTSTSAFGASPYCTYPIDWTLWHKRFGHLHHAAVQRMYKDQLVDGMILKSQQPPAAICEPCLAGKQHHVNVPKTARHRATAPLQLIHTDVHGPLPVQSRHGYKYWITFIDDYSRHSLCSAPG